MRPLKYFVSATHIPAPAHTRLTTQSRHLIETSYDDSTTLADSPGCEGKVHWTPNYSGLDTGDAVK